MLLAGVSTIKNNLKRYLDAAAIRNETVIVTQKNKNNVVLISEEEYNKLVKKYKNV